jgi:NitT/TauT family transport system substrate-binding protein
MRRDIRAVAICGIIACAALVLSHVAHAAEAKALRLAKGYGITYLPLVIAAEERLVEKELERRGLGSVQVTWTSFSGGTAMNDALIAGQLDIANGHHAGECRPGISQHH